MHFGQRATSSVHAGGGWIHVAPLPPASPCTLRADPSSPEYRALSNADKHKHLQEAQARFSRLWGEAEQAAQHVHELAKSWAHVAFPKDWGQTSTPELLAAHE